MTTTIAIIILSLSIMIQSRTIYNQGKRILDLETKTRIMDLESQLRMIESDENKYLRQLNHTNTTKTVLVFCVNIIYLKLALEQKFCFCTGIYGTIDNMNTTDKEINNTHDENMKDQVWVIDPNAGFSLLGTTQPSDQS